MKESFTLEREDGRASTATLKNERKIGNGHYGEVYEARIALETKSRQKDEERIKEIEKTFIVKKFKEKAGDADDKKAADSLQKHARLQELGIHTFPTYRIVKGENSVLMTNLQDEGFLVLSSSGSDASRDKNFFHDYQNQVQEITHVEEPLRRLVQDGLKAASGAVFIPGDAFFYKMSLPVEQPLELSWFQRMANALVVEKKPANIKTLHLADIVVGDLDNVKIQEHANDTDLVVENLAAIKVSFSRFVNQVTDYSPKVRERYIAVLDKIIRDVLIAQGSEAKIAKIQSNAKSTLETWYGSEAEASLSGKDYFHE
jgi:hypothetical protein